eukprot:182765-Pyramimonas_sp.AAC.1
MLSIAESIYDSGEADKGPGGKAEAMAGHPARPRPTTRALARAVGSLPQIAKGWPLGQPGRWEAPPVGAVLR